ncbi:MAG TPA: tetratricopeptide repeat protein, partial [Candidatus Wallbacteria bacterium]|nr:tetratricopeptide repeat protein [Candidatus Wallbacteria bacterium]
LKCGFCHFMLKQYAEAHEKFEAIVAMGDEKYSLTCYIQLAEIAAIKNNASQASAYYEKAFALAPSDGEIVKKLADTYFKLGRFSEAAEKYKALLNISPRLKEAEFKLGVLYTRTSNYNDAIFYLNRVAGEYEDNIDFISSVSRCEFELRRFDDAMTHYKRLLTYEPDNTDALYKIAEIDYGRKNYEEAQLALNKYIKIKPGDFNAYLLNGHCARKMNNFDAAVANYMKCREIAPEYCEVNMALGALYFDLHKEELALACFNKVIEKEPFNVNANYMSALSYMALSNFTAAAAGFKKVIELQPANKEALIKLARIRKMNENYEEATTLFMKALEISPDMPEITLEIGECLMNARRFAEAVSYFLKLLSAEPKNARALLNLAKIKEGLGETNNALSFYERLFEVDENSIEACAGMAKILYARGQLDKAMFLYQKALKLRPDDLGIMTSLSEIYLKLKHEPEALSVFNEMLRIDPKNTGAMINLAKLYRSRSQFSDALKHYIALGFDYESAMVYKELGETANALTYFEKAIKSDAGNINARTEIGELYLKQKKYSDALKHLAAVIELKPDSFRARYLSGLACFEQGLFERCRNEFEQCVKIDGTSADSFFYLAESHYNLENFAAARQNYLKALSLACEIPLIHNRLGFINFKEHNYEMAETEFKKALAKDAANVEANYHLALIEIAHARYNDAILRLKKITLNRNTSDTYAKLAEALYKSGHCEQALEEALNSLKKDPNNTDAHYYLGLSQKELKRYRDAETSFIKCCEIN